MAEDHQKVMNKKYPAVVFTAPNEVAVGSVERAVCGPTDIGLRTRYSMISPGTELRMLAGHYGAGDKVPYVPGYSSVGEVIEVGTDAKLCKIGKRADVLPTLRAILDGAYSEDAIASHIAANARAR